MKQKKRNQGNFDNSEQNGNSSVSDELTLAEEAGFLIQIAFEEFEEIVINYPHHAAYCFASITRLVDTTENLSYFTRRLGMWLWIEVLAFQTEEPLDLTEFVEQFEMDVETIQTGINELVNAEEFQIEWEQEKQIKLVPRMAKETVIHFAERVLSGIRAGKQEEGIES